MKLKIPKKMSSRTAARIKNKVRIRRKVAGTAERPRLAVYRSCKYIYAQIIDDSTGKTLASANSVKAKNGSIEAAKAVGQEIAKKAMEKQIKDVVFDRSGYIYHGRIKGVAEGAREAGLNF